MDISRLLAWWNGGPRKEIQYEVGDLVMFFYFEQPWTYQRDIPRVGKILRKDVKGKFYLVACHDEIGRVMEVVVKRSKIKCRLDSGKKADILPFRKENV